MSKYIFIILFFILIATFIFIIKKNKQDYYSYEKIYFDKLHRQTTTIEQKNILLENITKAALKVDSLKSKYEKDLTFAKIEIEALNIKLNRVKTLTLFENKIVDTFVLKLTDTLFFNQNLKIGSFDDDYLSGEFCFFPLTDSLSVNYSITDTIIIIDSWIRKPNRRGEQVFFLWRWIKPWQVKCDIKSKNPHSTISNGQRLLIHKR